MPPTVTCFALPRIEEFLDGASPPELGIMICGPFSLELVLSEDALGDLLEFIVSVELLDLTETMRGAARETVVAGMAGTSDW